MGNPERRLEQVDNSKVPGGNVGILESIWILVSCRHQVADFGIGERRQKASNIGEAEVEQTVPAKKLVGIRKSRTGDVRADKANTVASITPIVVCYQARYDVDPAVLNALQRNPPHPIEISAGGVDDAADLQLIKDYRQGVPHALRVFKRRSMATYAFCIFPNIPFVYSREDLRGVYFSSMPDVILVGIPSQ